LTRRCLSEVLAEKVMSGNLSEPQAMQIGTQIIRDNALDLFPRLKARLPKDQRPTFKIQTGTGAVLIS
jgi:hypothetical protein